MTPIAIVGIGCRFAGAPDAHAFWSLCLEGGHAFSTPPPDRWDASLFYDANKRATDRSYAPTGAFLPDVRTFPALHFGIPPRRVEVMDPQQRLAIEIAWEALADAGYRSGGMPRKTGVFIGVTASEYRTLMTSRLVAQLMAAGAFGTAPTDPGPFVDAVDHVAPSRPFTAPGALANMVAAAVAQELDLHGPAWTTDAACASGLVALYDAVAQLRAGSLDAALAGGVYLCLSPENHIAFSRIGAISASGVCRPFDARADGFVQGDGAGIVVLKRLSDAVRDGDRIYATIRGIAANNDGRGDGPMAPLQSGQAEVISDAWADAGTAISDLAYVEAHGTGTEVGDAIELRALASALAAPEGTPVGSAKGNVGHTMSAAGIAGLIRAAFVLHYRTVVPLAGFASAKAELGLEKTPFRIPTAPEPCARTLTAVSSFGFGGTNVHAVLERAERSTPKADEAELWLLSAPDEPALRAFAGRIAETLRNEPGVSSAGVARALAVRPPLAVRAAITATDLASGIESLRALSVGRPCRGLLTGTAAHRPRVAFLFPGQGAQRPGMLAKIAQRLPSVSADLEAMQSQLDGHLPAQLLTLLWPTSDDDQARRVLRATDVCQPVLFAVGEALRRLLNTVGVSPVVAAGHSLGEFNAAVAGGVLTAEDALGFVTRRGRSMATIPGDPGSMVALKTDAATVASILVPGARIANINHPAQVVVSGRTQAVADVAKNALEAGLDPVNLDVSHGFHSEVFDALDVSEMLAQLPIRDPTLPVASGIASTPYANAAEALAVFSRHAASPVDFVGALHQCMDVGVDIFLQVGAGGPLASFARRVAPDVRAITLTGLDDNDGVRSLFDGLGALWIAGCDLDALPLCGPAQVVALPPTPLPRESYWVIKSEAQLPLVVAGDRPRQATLPPASATQPVVIENKPEADDVYERVAGVVARVSSYPRASLRPDQALLDDLGFDSLMVADLSTGLADAFPGLGGLPQELMLRKPTVHDLAEHVRSGAGDTQHADDDLPLLAYKTVWVDAHLPETTAPFEKLRGRAFRLVGTVPNLERRLEQAGASVGPNDLLVWVAQPSGPSLGDVFSGAAQPPDPLDDFLETLGGTPRDVLVLLTPDDLWSAGILGAVRALAREWPDHVVKAVSADADAADRLLREWVSEDRTPESRWTGSRRQVPGFALAESDPFDIGPGDVVAISGGTRGLGAQIGVALAAKGARVQLLGRGALNDVAKKLVADGAQHIVADVTDPGSLSAVAGATVLVHAAGVLADGAVGDTSRVTGRLARQVKVAGFANLIAAAGPSLRLAFALGSWAGRMGSRHQVHYAAANAQLAALAEGAGVRRVVAEYGPFAASSMAAAIPGSVAAAMRADGVDFASPSAGVAALLDDLFNRQGVITRGRALPWTTRQVEHRLRLNAELQPFLLDHAVDGIPVLPMAAAADLIAWTAGLTPPFAIEDLALFGGVAVREPLQVSIHVNGERAEIRTGPRAQLAWRARVRPCEAPEDPGPLPRGEAPTLSLRKFYGGVTFHGPLLQGLLAVDDVGETSHGSVRTTTPEAWGFSNRTSFSVDPLALDSAFQLAAFTAWQRWERAGLPVGLRRLVVAAPWKGPLSVALRAGDQQGDRFEGDLVLRDAQGVLVGLVDGAVAELRSRRDEAPTFDPVTVDPSRWQEVMDLRQRLDMVSAIGIRNPYFAVHEGTARNTTVVAGRTLINFSSYNYLGLSGDPRVIVAVKEAIDRYGTSVSASRVASGERPFHLELEAKLARAQGAEDAVLFTAGHATNVTTIGHLVGPGDLVLHDALIHDSVLQGIKLSGAGRRGFRHEDPSHLEQLLRDLRSHHRRVLVVVEGVYSMDGDLCSLPEYVTLKERYGALLMVDEAHSFGVVGARGCGIGEHHGVDGRRVDIWMGTLSKSLASCGGWIAASKALVTYLRYTAPGFVYSAGLTPANGVAALKSLDLLLEEPWRVTRLQANAARFHDGLVAAGVDTGPSRGGSAVVPAVTGNSMHALQLSNRLNDQGINVQPIVYPAVADDAARLRFFLSSTHTDDELDQTAAAVGRTLAAVRADFPF